LFNNKILVYAPPLNKFPVTDVWFVDYLTTLYLLRGLFVSKVARGGQLRRMGEEGGIFGFIAKHFGELE
jgi:hypothetical protein